MTDMTQTAQLKNQVTINAPAGKIFAILSDLETSAKLIPGVTPTARDDDAILVDYAVRLLGINLPITFRSVRLRIVDSQEPAALTMSFDGPIKGTFNWKLQSQDNSTLLTVDTSYQMNTEVIAKALGAVGSGAAGGGLIGGAFSGVTSVVNQAISSLLNANSSAQQQWFLNLKKASES
jgi:carbon monoxide dehydrogenase subunit G